MDLKTFVKETLTQIAEGVNEAKPLVKRAGGHIIDMIPSSMGENIPNCICDDRIRHPVTKLDFDVALEITKGEGAKSGIGVAIASLAGGAKKEASSAQSSFSRVAFTLYVSLQ